MALEEKLEYQMTQEGYDKLVEELEHYKKVKRPEVIDKITIARSFGDLSENSEYDAAKDEQGFIEQRILEMEQMIRYAVIIEGMFGLYSEKLRELMDIKIFVDTPSDLRILRRLLRDINERGRTVESVINQYLVSVRPMHEKYIKPTKQYADIIVPDGGYNDIAIDILITKIKSLLAK